MNDLLLPAHIAERRRKQAEATANSISQSSMNRLMSDDFLDKPGVQLQLDALEDYLYHCRQVHPDYYLPKPSGWRLQVLMLTIPEKSDGGIIIVDDNREQRSMASPQGVILAIGRACYTDEDRFTVDGILTPWHKVGDRIQFVKYDAQPFQLANGQRLGILTDTQPVATIDSGWKVPT